MNQSRFERQERLFTKEGQMKIEKTSVSIIGVGGIGSHIAQQLAFLGVDKFYLIDSDILETTNMNRFIGGKYDDAISRLLKIDIAERLIRSINPKAQIFKISKNLLSEMAITSIINSNFAFGCVDNDGPRLVLTEICSAYNIPYMDLSTEILTQGQVDFGGRVQFCYDGNGCLMCYDELDQDEITEYLENPEQKRDRKEIYGIKREDLMDSGPAVVSLNGLIASLALIEFMIHVTGVLRPAKRILYYRGRWGIITSQNEQSDLPKPDCYYCKGLRGKRENINIKKYFKF